MFTHEHFESLHDLYVHELKDLYDAEHRFLELVPDLKEKANCNGLIELIESARVLTEAQKGKLETVFQDLNIEPERESCPAMKGIIAEAKEMLKAKGDACTRDAAIIGSINRIQHYEIAGYGTLSAFAESLGHKDHAKTLAINTTIGKVIDHAASILSEQVNAAAAV